MEAVVDTHFSLSYRSHVLNFLFPLFPPLEARSPHIHAVTRLLVTLSDASLTVPLLVSLVPREKLLAYQLAFDLVEGGAQDFLEAIRTDLPKGDEVCTSDNSMYRCNRSDMCHLEHEGRLRKASTNFDWTRIRQAVPPVLEAQQ